MDPERRKRLEELPGWVWSRQSERWENGIAALKRFSDREGHCRVPEGYKTDDGFALGAWVLSQRENKIDDPDRQQRLAALPDWSWAPEADRLDAKWEEGFAHLKHFSERKGHSRVTSLYKTEDGYYLGLWVRRQREKNADGVLRVDRQQRLGAIPGWTWTPKSDTLTVLWEEGFAHLKQFSDREGHSQVPYYHKTESGFWLGRWVTYRRRQFTQGKMDPVQQQNLEALPGWAWNFEAEKFQAAWEEGFTSLKLFVEREGHSQVPLHHETDNAFRLGGWVSRQRKNFKADKLDPDRRQRLEALPGWVWKIEK
jgi:hypothetical protein